MPPILPLTGTGFGVGPDFYSVNQVGISKINPYPGIGLQSQKKTCNVSRSTFSPTDLWHRAKQNGIDLLSMALDYFQTWLWTAWKHSENAGWCQMWRWAASGWSAWAQCWLMPWDAAHCTQVHSALLPPTTILGINQPCAQSLCWNSLLFKPQTAMVCIDLIDIIVCSGCHGGWWVGPWIFYLSGFRSP